MAEGTSTGWSSLEWSYTALMCPLRGRSLGASSRRESFDSLQFPGLAALALTPTTTYRAADDAVRSGTPTSNSQPIRSPP